MNQQSESSDEENDDELKVELKKRIKDELTVSSLPIYNWLKIEDSTPSSEKNSFIELNRTG